MAWPTNKPDSDKFSSDGDSIKDSRPELKTMSDAVNDIVDFVDTSNIQNNYILKYNSSSGRLEFVAESGGGGGTTTVDINAGTGITVSSPDSAGGYTIATTALLNVSEDTTPQLGGNLDAQSNNITNLGTLNTHTIPGGTGTLALTSDIPSSIDTQIVAGTGISVSQPDSGGAFTITNTSPGGGSISPLTADLDTKDFTIGNLTVDSAGELAPTQITFGNSRQVYLTNEVYGRQTVSIENYKTGRTAVSGNALWGALQLRSGTDAGANSYVTCENEGVMLQTNSGSDFTEDYDMSVILSESYGIEIKADNALGHALLRPKSSIFIRAKNDYITLASPDGISFCNAFDGENGQEIVFKLAGNSLNDYNIVWPANFTDGFLKIQEGTPDSGSAPAGGANRNFEISSGPFAGAGYLNGGIKTTSFNALSGYQYIINGALTATLPASPGEGDRISFVSINTGAFTVNRNGNNIDGAASNFTRNPNLKSNEDTYIYTNGAEGWQLV